MELKKQRYVLFDLDGTLVPLARQLFEPAVFQDLNEMIQRHFPERPETLEAVKRAMSRAVMEADGRETNEERLRRIMEEEAGWSLAHEILCALEEHYQTDYNQIGNLIRDPSVAPQALELVRRYGGVPVIATNPIAPRSCIYARVQWAGVRPGQFRLVTTSEICRYVKPDPSYYREVLGMLRADPCQCIMIGNDTEDDMQAAQQVGIDTFLMTDYLMDRQGTVEQYRHGDRYEMMKYLEIFLSGGNATWTENR